MKLCDFIAPENSGKQLWQMVISNITKGTHPYNFQGFCMALVTQWLLELRFPEGRTPDELGRYLLKEKLGNKGYEGIATSQDIYERCENDAQMISRHSGMALQLGTTSGKELSYKSHWLLVRSRIYGVPADETIRLHDQSKVYSGLIGIEGNRNKLLKIFMGDNWAHAIGVHSTTTHVYIFDPNYGVFVFDQKKQGAIASFFEVLWNDYGVAAGTIADVTAVAP